MYAQLEKAPKKRKTNNGKKSCTVMNNQKGLMVQRKVGFEFQTVGGKWNVKTRANHAWKDLDHGDTVLDDRVGFKVFNDFNDLEYVTSPKDANTLTDVNLLATQIGSAANYHNKLSNGEKPNDTWSSSHILSRTYLKKKVNDVTYYINSAGEKTAHPQATIGVKLERLIELADEWSKKKSEQKRNYKTIGWGNYKEKKQKKALREAVFSAENEVGLSDKGKGFLLLVTSYVNGAAVTGLTPNAKNATPLMSRTNFVSLYRLLDLADQQELNNLLGSDAGRQGYFNNINPILVKETGSELRLEDWWSNIIKVGADAKDKLQDFNGLSDTTNLEVNGYINSPTDIGKDQDGNDMSGVLLEMRNLGRKVESSDWEKVAKAVLNIVKDINSN